MAEETIVTGATAAKLVSVLSAYSLLIAVLYL
jgi:hypothetical protein